MSRAEQDETHTIPHLLSIPARAQVRRAPVETPRLLLVPIEISDGDELWGAVEGSRWHLERWLPWVPFNNAREASARYAEACAGLARIVERHPR